jgi:hypothetical protein
VQNGDAHEVVPVDAIAGRIVETLRGASSTRNAI